MTDINLNGQWTFVIVYGEEYGDDANKEVYFEGDFIQNDDTFTATGFDTGGFGVNPDIAKIYGFIKGDEISFVKQYSSNHYFGESGKLIIDRSKIGPEINYFGTYNKIENIYTGNWDMVIVSQQLDTGWLEWDCTGTWSMRRK